MNKDRIIFTFAILFFSLFGMAKSSEAATNWVVSDCTAAVINDALANTEFKDGDTINVPGDHTCIYSTNDRVYVRNKQVSIIGGYGGGTTTIIDQTTNSWAQQPFYMYNDSKGWRISNFTFLQGGTDETYTDQYGFIFGLQNSGTPIISARIDHCNFGTASNPLRSTYGFLLRGMIWGVADHNNFYRAWSGGGSPHSMSITGRTDVMDNALTGIYGDYLWSLGPSFGTANAFYVEDNEFYSTDETTVPNTVYDIDDGARIVFRHNTLQSTYLGCHGRDGTFVHRGGMTYEIYDNTLNWTKPDKYYTAIGVRSGTGVIYNNTLSGGYYYMLRMYNYCACTACGVCTAPGYNCPQTSYPQSDQVGWTSDGAGGQKSEPLYMWNNTLDDGILESSIWDVITLTPTYDDCSGAANLIKYNRDVFASGIPKPGYAPYTYPHPLTLTGSGDTTPPAAPHGLAVQ